MSLIDLSDVLVRVSLMPEILEQKDRRPALLYADGKLLLQFPIRMDVVGAFDKPWYHVVIAIDKTDTPQEIEACVRNIVSYLQPGTYSLDDIQAVITVSIMKAVQETAYAGDIVYAFDTGTIPTLDGAAIERAAARHPDQGWTSYLKDVSPPTAYADILCWEIKRAYPRARVTVTYDHGRATSVDLRKGIGQGAWPSGEGDILAIAKRVLDELRAS